MSGRLISTRLATIARRAPLNTTRFYTSRSLPAGGLLRSDAGLRLIKRRPWPLGSYALHNLPATRSISFARAIPKLVTKFATAGAAAGGAVIAGVSYLQYQAGRELSHAVRYGRALANPLQRPEVMRSIYFTEPGTAQRESQARHSKLLPASSTR